MPKLKRVLSAIDATSKWSGYVVMFGTLVITLFLTIEVVARYVFNAPTLWATESTSIAYGIMVLIAGAYVLLTGGHVNMDALYSRLSPRRKAALDIFTSVFFFTFCVILLRNGIPLAIKAIVLQEHSQSAWGAPWWPTRMAIPIGAFLILLQGLAKLIRDFYTVVTGSKLV